MGSTQSREAAPQAPQSVSRVQQSSSSSTDEPTCPVPESVRSRAVYNVYNQRINDPDAKPSSSSSSPLDLVPGYDSLDPSNMMPREPNQQPCPGQRKLLSTDRINSNIPKGGTDSTWLYPSPQMFYNALKRKGKGDDVTEDDMDSVVHAHNTMNELTWQRVAVWEMLHRAECPSPSLLRFRGRPDDLSPLARVRSWFGKQLPFDRHDWYVDRCGKEVRYVIDFYYDDDKAGTPEAFEVTVRPALDSLDAFMDRLRMQVYMNFAKYGLPCPVTGTAGEVGQAAQQPQQQQHPQAANTS
ncbi:hypothetical protein N2152v2_006173 [Parachlorella kessleri]